MRVLIGQVIQDKNILNTVQMTYADKKGFFVALVNICDELDVDIPIWTAMEEKLLDKKGEVLVPLEQGGFLRISHASQGSYVQ
ncbi:hypothetical protein [Petroclostridium sp. X23]|uniref:hypothetical protein n=1 Tax=Petroclostridium sp. X23 TaxID=3045146 RepID=UPI0024AD5697|nr:hypothetical protein [Petroclostridium sp. X23]WHH57088.1 hypothetical protein QKW49_14700 [Petroclostridium sp. X23]